MASMNISLPERMRDYVQDRIESGQYGSVSDYVRDLIRRDQGAMEDEESWLRDLDRSVVTSLAEMQAGEGSDLHTACDALLVELETGDRADA